ncbi:hypothetical protein RB195_001195 [Necator americanus]|uniref:Saposin B-type domain-containing protein n=1 Tax=Necator americanus TaxID=51031 RepID=A0ABR1DDT0_NECAM
MHSCQIILTILYLICFVSAFPPKKDAQATGNHRNDIIPTAITLNDLKSSTLTSHISDKHDCPGRAPLRHLCLPCKALVYSFRSTLNNFALVRKGMSRTCSIVLHPHSYICKAAMEVFFLLMRHTSNERICQHLLVCELNAHHRKVKSHTLDPVATKVLQIFNEGLVTKQEGLNHLDASEKEEIADRVINELLVASGYYMFSKVSENAPRQLFSHPFKC